MGGQLAINAILAAAHYGLIALSFAFVSRTARFFHVAHGAVYTIAAYLAMSLIGTGMEVFMAVVIAIVAGGIIGCAMEFIVFRPLRRMNASPEILLLASFGLLIALQNIAALIWGNARQALWIRPAEPGLLLFGGYVTNTQLTSIGLSLSVAVGLIAWSRMTFGGLMLRAVGDDPQLSQIRGIHRETAILTCFAVASGVMALAGILQAVDTGLTPLMGFRALLVAFVGALLGGLHSDIRAFLGGVVIGAFEQVAAIYLPGQWYESLILLLLVVALVTRGQHLLGGQSK